MTTTTKPANAAPPPTLRIQRDYLGRAIRVYLGQVDITRLVARVQTNTTLLGTTTEVVLTERTAEPSLQVMH